MNTLMKWKDCVGKGWHAIVIEAITKIEAHSGFVVQVKEKFGGLRIYVQGGDYDAISDVVRDAEAKASLVCEECGQPGQIMSIGGWYKTRCLDHIENAEIYR